MAGEQAPQEKWTSQARVPPGSGISPNTETAVDIQGCLAIGWQARPEERRVDHPGPSPGRVGSEWRPGVGFGLLNASATLQSYISPPVETAFGIQGCLAIGKRARPQEGWTIQVRVPARSAVSGGQGSGLGLVKASANLQKYISPTKETAFGIQGCLAIGR